MGKMGVSHVQDANVLDLCLLITGRGGGGGRDTSAAATVEAAAELEEEEEDDDEEEEFTSKWTASEAVKSS